MRAKSPTSTTATNGVVRAVPPRHGVAPRDVRGSRRVGKQTRATDDLIGIDDGRVLFGTRLFFVGGALCRQRSQAPNDGFDDEHCVTGRDEQMLPFGAGEGDVGSPASWHSNALHLFAIAVKDSHALVSG